MDMSNLPDPSLRERCATLSARILEISDPREANGKLLTLVDPKRRLAAFDLGRKWRVIAVKRDEIWQAAKVVSHEKYNNLIRGQHKRSLLGLI